MALDLHHHLRVSFTPPVRECHVLARLEPFASDTQVLEDFALIVDPPARPQRSLDGLGNACHAVDLRGEIATVTFAARAGLSLNRSQPVPSGDGDPWAAIAALKSQGAFWDFLTLPGAPPRSLQAFAEAQGFDSESDPLRRLLRVSEALQRLFDKAAPDDALSLNEALTSARMNEAAATQVAVALARGWGVPTRFVMGYRLTGGDQASMGQWLGCYLPDLGWVDLDPWRPISGADKRIGLVIGREGDDLDLVRHHAKGDCDVTLEHKVARAGRARVPPPAASPHSPRAQRPHVGRNAPAHLMAAQQQQQQ